VGNGLGFIKIYDILALLLKNKKRCKLKGQNLQRLSGGIGVKMSYRWWPRKIHCPNCDYEGRARLKGSGCLGWIAWLALFFISFHFWPLFIVTALLSLYLLVKPPKQICPKCSWEFPIPLSSYKVKAKG